MPAATVAVVHTAPVTIEPLKSCFARLLPEVRVINIADDSLIADVLAAGGVTKAVARRMLSYFSVAESMGVDVILNACSSVGETVDLAQALISVPIVKIDEAMAEKAVELGSTIAVVATARTTLDPTVRLIRNKAGARGKAVGVSGTVVPGAFECLLAGKGEEHDWLVLTKIREAAETADVVVLAQASMARLIPRLEGGVHVPVLSSPELGVARVRQVLEERASPVGRKGAAQ
ncbi:MAG: aspartate/glutamate racemase family protein [Bacillota bacterium]|nr:aspartate/glutamate racemase family protein [Bacillota bacterium]